MTRNLGPKLVAVVAASMFALTACGSSSNTDDTTNTNSSNGDGGSVSEPADDQTPAAPDTTEADQAIADASLLTLKDFPAGWEASPSNDDDDKDVRAAQEKIAQCVGVSYADLYDNAGVTADSPDFTSEDDEQVSDTVAIAADEARMISVFKIASQPKYRECTLARLGDQLEKAVKETGEDVKIGKVSLNDMSFGAYGDETIAYKATIPMTLQGLSVDYEAEYVLVRVGRGRTLLMNAGLGSGLSTDEFATYVDTATKRLQAELATS